MKYYAIVLLLSFGACFAGIADVSPIVIDNVTVTDAPVTEVNPSSTVVPPQPTPSPNVTTTPPPTTSIKPTTTTSTPKPTTVSPNTTSAPTKPTTTTPVTTTIQPTPAPAPNSTTAPITTTTASPHHGRKFDGLSFFGGIILALGLVAIGFMALKFYKARTELNYHTL